MIPYSEDMSQWSMPDGAVTGPLGLNALGRFAGYGVQSGGLISHTAHAMSADLSAGPHWLTLFLRAGSSGSLLVYLRDSDAGTAHNYRADIGDWVLNDGIYTLHQAQLQADGQSWKLILRMDVGFTGPSVLRFGPSSATIGEDVILLGAQFEAGPAPSPYQYRAG